MDEEHLQDLVVRLVGDPTVYFKMLDTAATKTKEFSQEVIGVLAGIGSALAVGGAFEMYSNLEQTTIRLGAAIRSSGRDVTATLDEYRAFADQMSRMTLTGKTATLQLLQQAEAFGVSGDKAKEAVKAAISVAALRPGMSPEAAIGPVASAIATGDMQRLTRLIPTLRGIKDASERAAKAQQLLGVGWQMAQELAGTASGAVIRLGQSLKGFVMAAGEAAAKYIQPLVERITELVNRLKDNAPFKNATVAALGFFAAMTVLRPAIFAVSRAISAVQVSIKTLLGLVSWPRLLAVGALTAAAFLIKQHFGSWEKAWDAIKEKAKTVWGYLRAYWQEFVDWVTPYWKRFSQWLLGRWESFREWAERAWDRVKTAVGDFVFWARPIFRGLVDFFLSYWGFLARGAVAAWGFITKVVGQAASWIGDKLGMAFGKIDWRKTRLYLLMVLATAIYFFENFDKYMDLTVAQWRAGWESIKNDFTFLFTDQIPTALTWFRDHWKDLLIFMVSSWQIANATMTSMIVQTFKNLPALIQGKMQLQDVLAPVFEQFTGMMKAQLDQLASTLPTIPQRVMTDAEKALWQDFLRQQHAFIANWGDFVKGKLQDWMKDGGILPSAAEQEDMIRKGKDLGDHIGGGFAEHVKKETDKLEAHLLGSAEALAAVREYWDRLEEGWEKHKGGAEGAGGGGAEAATPTPMPTPAEKTTLGMDAVVAAIQDSTRRICATLAEPLPRTVNGRGNQDKPPGPPPGGIG